MRVPGRLTPTCNLCAELIHTESYRLCARASVNPRPPLLCKSKVEQVTYWMWRVPTSYLLGEFDALGVRQWFGLFVDVLDVEHLAHELNHRLSTVESGGWHCGDRDAQIISLYHKLITSIRTDGVHHRQFSCNSSSQQINCCFVFFKAHQAVFCRSDLIVTFQLHLPSLTHKKLAPVSHVKENAGSCVWWRCDCSGYRSSQTYSGSLGAYQLIRLQKKTQLPLTLQYKNRICLLCWQ